MKNKKLLYIITCVLGSAMIGIFANKLTEAYGCVLFGIGIGLLVNSIIKLCK